MRGNWGTAAAMANPAPPEQRIGHRIGAFRVAAEVDPHVNQPHSPATSATSATPAWNIADTIAVKEEPTSEDKNNDSGVSPGHYTSNSASPRSRRSSSTANGSLSPGSATSQDSSAMRCTMFDYSPQRVFKSSCTSPSLIAFGQLNNNGLGGVRGSPELKMQSNAPAYDTSLTLHDRRHSGQPLEMMVQVPKSSSIEPGTDDIEAMRDDSLQCPICAFTTVQRMEFNEHLAAHCSPKCSSTTPQPLSPNTVRGDDCGRSGHDSEEMDEPGLRVPRVNSQGKVKTFRCKQCSFVAVTKLEFWEHSRGHIKADKLLTCPKCPFVTEYKHHLEYHLRNHFGSKPFKCDKCSYSCVNKSMLNSHLKSHSNVYQYRCANCSYATKYCHSLKLHLRKYTHAPAMVLNADGSPNPLPIIDVYGTRRGPKQKYPHRKNHDESHPSSQQHELHEPTFPISNQSPQIRNDLSSNPVAGLPIPVPVTMSILQRANNIFQPAIVSSQTSPREPLITVPFPYSQIYTDFLNFSDNNNENKVEISKTGSQLCGYDTTINRGKMESVQKCDRGACPSPEPSGKRSAEESSTSSSPSSSPSSSTQPAAVEADGKTTPLDLSKPEVQPKAAGTSRRKGRAFRLDRLVVEHDSDDEAMDMANTATPPPPPPPHSPRFNLLQHLQRSYDKVDGNAFTAGTAGTNAEYNCQYCDIAFGNVVMYTMHMGYHGYKNPYTCNMCGQQCVDKVSFFLHIARSSHS